MEEQKAFNIRDYTKPLLMRKWLWIIPLVIFSLGATHISLNKPDVYESSCVLVLENSNLINTVLEGREAKHDTGKILTVVEERILGWGSVVKVIRDLELDKGIPEDDLGALEGLYWSVVNNTDLSAYDSKGKGRKIVITYRGADPEKTFKIVEAFASNFMEQTLSLSQDEVDKAIVFVTEDLEQLKRNFDESERKLRIFEEQHRHELPGSKDDSISRLSSAENELAAIDGEIIILQERLNFLQENGTIITSEGVQVFTPLGSNLSQQIIDLEMQLEMLQARYAEEHPEIVMRNNELAHLKEVLARESDMVDPEEGNSNVLTEREFESQLQLKSLQRRREGTENLIASLNESIKNMPNYNQEYYELQKDFNINKQLYEQRALQKSKTDLLKKISHDPKANPVTIVAHPRIPTYPLRSDKIKTMVMGLFIGAGLGIGMIFGLEKIDRRFKTEEEAQEYLQIPALGIIPTILTKTDIRRKIRKRIVVTSLLVVFAITVTTVSFVVQPVKDVVQPVKDVVNNDITRVIKLIKRN